METNSEFPFQVVEIIQLSKTFKGRYLVYNMQNLIHLWIYCINLDNLDVWVYCDDYWVKTDVRRSQFITDAKYISIV